MIETFRIALVGTGQIFGEEDVIKELEDPFRKYNTSVKCISNTADVFCMKYDEFLRKFKVNKESWKTIEGNCAEKEKMMKARYVNIISQIITMTITGKKINHK